MILNMETMKNVIKIKKTPILFVTVKALVSLMQARGVKIRTIAPAMINLLITLPLRTSIKDWIVKVRNDE